MKRVLCVILATALVHDVCTAAEGPSYTADGKMLPFSGYREWIFLSSGLDMTYSAPEAAAAAPSHSTFGNIFVNPESYRVFMVTGKWPDKTTLIIEVRDAVTEGSINKGGLYQTEFRGLEVHVKDEKRFPDKWAFFNSDGKLSASKIPETADCYSCHKEHGALDTTFVQFYPTLLKVAQERKTLERPRAPQRGKGTVQ
jgi:hypothetical protein